MIRPPDYGCSPMTMIPWLKKREALRRAQELLDACTSELGMEGKKLGTSAKDWISRRRWEDGSGEMRRAIYFAALAARDGTLEAAHFPPRCRRDHEAYSKASFESMSLEEMVGQKCRHFFERLGDAEASAVHRAVMEQVERPLIESCLSWADGNQLKASRVLGLGRNTLRKKMRDLGIKR